MADSVGSLRYSDLKNLLFLARCEEYDKFLSQAICIHF